MLMVCNNDLEMPADRFTACRPDQKILGNINFQGKAQFPLRSSRGLLINTNVLLTRTRKRIVSLENPGENPDPLK